MNSQMEKVFNDAWKGKYSEEQSEISKVHKLFSKQLELLRIREADFLQGLKTRNNLDRISYVANVITFNNIRFNHAFARRYQKSSYLAQKFREKGNIAYKLCNFREAIRGYNLSLVFAPTESPCIEFSLALSNRSAVYFQMGKYASSIRDVLRALALHCNPKTGNKLLERKAKCCRHLQLDPLEIEKKNPEYFDVLILETEELSLEGSKLKNEFCIHKIFKFTNQHPSITAAEDFVSILNNLERGRHVVTTKAVKPGTVLIIDEPYAKILLNELKWDLDHCHHCHRRTDSGISCPGCVFGFFCNETCRTAAMNLYHKFECSSAPFLYTLKAPRTLLLALRILTTLGPSEMFDFFKARMIDVDDVTMMSPTANTNNGLEILGNEDGVYNSHSYVPIHHLISHPEKCQVTELLSYCLTSLTMIKILDQYSQFFDNVDPKLKLVAASFILLHMQNLPCNAHSLNEFNLDTSVGDTSERIRSTVISEYGAGAFALLSLINHSCEPNVFRVNLHNGKTAVVSLRSMKPGDELLDNYGHHYALEDKSSRQMALLKNYYFECTCRACTCPERWPLLPDLKLVPETYVCPTCSSTNKNTDIGSMQVVMIEDGASYVCPSCDKKYSQEKVVEEFNIKIDDFFIAHELVLQNQPINALPYLTSCLDYFQTHLRRPFIRINESEETLKQAMNLVVN